MWVVGGVLPERKMVRCGSCGSSPAVYWPKILTLTLPVVPTV